MAPISPNLGLSIESYKVLEEKKMTKLLTFSDVQYSFEFTPHIFVTQLLEWKSEYCWIHGWEIQFEI